jgi:ADP-ribosylglycohydrolase
MLSDGAVRNPPQSQIMLMSRITHSSRIIMQSVAAMARSRAVAGGGERVCRIVSLREPTSVSERQALKIIED